MGRHALAFVQWKELRRGPRTRPAFRAHFYRSKKGSIYKVADEGTLWVVTSVVRSDKKRVHTLAYKLAGCVRVPKEEMNQVPIPKLGRYAVICTDTVNTHHFSFKPDTICDFTSEFRAMRFKDLPKIPNWANIGWWLRNLPEPNEAAVKRLVWMERKLLYGRRVLISYAHEDKALAGALEKGLQERGLTVWRDINDLRTGGNWKTGVRDNLEIAEAFLLLLSRWSIGNENVEQELQWALESYHQTNGVRGIFPVLAPGISHRDVPWEGLAHGPYFVPLRDLHAASMPARPGPAFFDRLLVDIAKMTTKRIETAKGV